VRATWTSALCKEDGAEERALWHYRQALEAIRAFRTST
jgi:hypothetical protein